MQRQVNGEGGGLRGGLLDFNESIQVFHNAEGHRQSQSGAFLFFFGCKVGFKNAFEDLRWNAKAADESRRERKSVRLLAADSS